MNDRTVGEATTRRRLLGAAGGAVTGAAVLSRLSDGTSGGAAEAGSQETDTPTPTPTPTPPGAVWPLFQLNALNTGNQPNDFGPDDSPGIAWSLSNGGKYTTTPVVTEGEVFAADEGADVVRAVDVDSGGRLWEADIETRNARMTIQDRVLYVPTSESTAQLRALDPDDGSEQWSVTLQDTANGVVADGGTLYVSTTGGVSKVSSLSESVDWEYDGVTLLDTTIAQFGDSVYAAGTQNGKVVKLGVSGGSESWTNIVGGKATGAPTISGTELLVPFDEQLAALRTDSGREVWRYEHSVGSSVAVDDDTIYGTRTDGTVFALDPANGDPKWETSPISGSNPPLLVGRQLFVAGTNGTVAALNPRDGSTLWTVDLGASLTANPAVYAGELYLGDGSGQLVALAEGAGGVDTPTDTPTDSPTASPTDSPTQPPDDDGGDDTGGDDDDDGGGILLSPTPTESDGGGGLDLPLVGGIIAAVVATLGGGLWWRNRGGDEYDPLG